MDTLSYIMPKLAWIIPLGLLIFVGYIVIKKIQSNKMDTYIKEYGVNVDAIIVEVVPDENQEVNNKIVAVVSVQYIFNGETIISKRGLRFCITDKDKFEPGKSIKIRVNPERPDVYYYIQYENIRLNIKF